MVGRRPVRARRLWRIVRLSGRIRDLEGLQLRALHAIVRVRRLRGLRTHTILSRTFRRRSLLTLLLHRLRSRRRTASRNFDLLLLPSTTTLRLWSHRRTTLRHVRTLGPPNATTHERRRPASTHAPTVVRGLTVLTMTTHRLVAHRDGRRRRRLHGATVVLPRGRTRNMRRLHRFTTTAVRGAGDPSRRRRGHTRRIVGGVLGCVLSGVTRILAARWTTTSTSLPVTTLPLPTKFRGVDFTSVHVRRTAVGARLARARRKSSIMRIALVG